MDRRQIKKQLDVLSHFIKNGESPEPNDNLLVSAGYGAFLVAKGRVLQRLGHKRELLEAVRPFFYAFQLLPNGYIVLV